MSNLTLDENHRYWLDGKPVDGLTSTIKEAGLIRNSDPFYADRGTKIHLATQYWDEGVLDEETVDPQIKGYLKSWKKFRVDQSYTPEKIEYQIYNPELKVGMKIDRLPGPIDLKTGSYEPWHILQIAVQWFTLKMQDKRNLVRLAMDVYLDPDGDPPKLKPYTYFDLNEAYKVYCSMLYFIRWRREKYGNTSSNHQS